ELDQGTHRAARRRKGSNDGEGRPDREVSRAIAGARVAADGDLPAGRAGRHGYREGRRGVDGKGGGWDTVEGNRKHNRDECSTPGRHIAEVAPRDRDLGIRCAARRRKAANGGEQRVEARKRKRRLRAILRRGLDRLRWLHNDGTEAWRVLYITYEW